MSNSIQSIFLTALLALPFTAIPDQHHLKAMDIFDLEYATDPRVSPDGGSVVYVRKSFDVMADKSRSNIWQVNLDGSFHRPLLSAANNYSSPRWSPEGNRIAYLTRYKKRNELRVRWLDTGQDALIAITEKSPSSVTWSNNGEWIAFTMNVPGERNKLVKPRKKPEGAKWAQKSIEVDTVRYQFDGRGIVEPEYGQVFVVPGHGGTPRQLTTGRFDHDGRLSWSMDDDHILFAANRHEDWELQTIESDIYRVDVVTGGLTQITNAPGAETSPMYSPNGKAIAYLQTDNDPVTYRHRRVAVMNADGSNARLLTKKLDVSASHIHWAKNSNAIYYQFDERANRKIGRVDLKGKSKTIIGGVGGTAIGRPYLGGMYNVSNNKIVYTKGTTHRPSDLATPDRLLTDLNDDLLTHKQLGEVHEIVYESSFDRQEIQGWYVTPPDFDGGKRYPMILEIHGGPNSAYGPEFSAEIQLMAAAGYVVFYDNYRDSTSYGKDFALLL